MKKIIIKGKKGYLLKKFNLSNEDIIFLKDKNLLLELNEEEKKKYHDNFILLEEGYYLVKLSNIEERYNCLRKYLLLASNMEFMNKEYLNKLESVYPSKVDYPKDIVFFKGQIYDITFFKSIFKVINDKVYDNDKVIGKLIKGDNLYLFVSDF